MEVETNSPDEGYYIIDFSVNNTTKKTGTGHEIKVFSTVLNIVERWFNDMKTKKIPWSTIEFSASKDGSTEASTGRERLYARFAKMLAKKHGAKAKIEKEDDHTMYYITRSLSESNSDKRLKSFKDILNEIGDRPMKIDEFDLNKKNRRIICFCFNRWYRFRVEY